MKIYYLNLYFVCFLFFQSCTNGVIEDEKISNTIPEQLALDIFVDSILYKTYYYNIDTTNILLVPENYHESWEQEGLFHNWVIYSDSSSIGLSRPYYTQDMIELSNLKEQEKKDLISLINSYDSLQVNYNTVPLRIKDISLNPLSMKDFLSDTVYQHAFVKVRKHLQFNKGYFVQISLISKEFVAEPIFGDSLERYEFYFWFDRDFALSKWE